MSAPALAWSEPDAPTTGVIEALVAVTGVLDEVGDVLVPGAFARTLRQRTPRPCLLHAWERKIGDTLSIRELLPGDPRLPEKTAEGKPWPREAGGVVARYQTDDSPDGQWAHALTRSRGPARMMHSIGYKTRRFRRGTGAVKRYVTDLDLWEYSQVPNPAMRLAVGLSIKAGDVLTSPVGSVHQDVGLEVKMSYVRDAAYWGYPIGTPITARMKPRGRPAIAVRQRGHVPSTNVGVTDTKPDHAPPASAAAHQAGDHEGALFPEPDSAARVHAGPGATGDITTAVDNLVRELTDRGGRPDTAYPTLLHEGVTPAELEEDLRQSDQWSNTLTTAQRDDHIASAVEAYRGAYTTRAGRQTTRRADAQQWQQPSREEIDRLANEGEGLIGDSQGDAQLATILGKLGHPDPEAFVEHLWQIIDDSTTDNATTAFIDFVDQRRAGASEDPNLPSLPDLPELAPDLRAVDDTTLTAQLATAQQRLEGLRMRGTPRGANDLYDAQHAIQDLAREQDRRAAAQAERDRIEAARAAEDAASSTHVVPDSPAARMTPLEFEQAGQRGMARRMRAEQVRREQDQAATQAGYRNQADQLADTAPTAISLAEFQNRYPQKGAKAQLAGSDRLVLVAGTTKNWQLATAGNMILVSGGEFSPGTERSAETPKNPGKRALADLANRIAALSDTNGRPAPWTAPLDPGDKQSATWVQGWRDPQGRNAIAATVATVDAWAKEHDLHYIRAGYQQAPDIVPGGEPDADGFRTRRVVEIAPGDEVRLPDGDTATVIDTGLHHSDGSDTGALTLEGGRAISVAELAGQEKPAPADTSGRLRTAQGMRQAGVNISAASTEVPVRFAGEPDLPEASNDPGMGATAPGGQPPGQPIGIPESQWATTWPDAHSRPLPAGTRFVALRSAEPSPWGRDERPAAGITMARTTNAAGYRFQTVRYDDGTYGAVRVEALRGSELAPRKTAQRYVLEPTPEQVTQVHEEWGLGGSNRPVGAEPVDSSEPTATTGIPAELLDEAAVASDETLGITETEDGTLEATPEVADRQDRVAALFDEEQAGRLDLAAKSNDELSGIRTDLIDELALQTALERRTSAAVARPKPAVTPEAPKVRAGLAGAAQDHAEALRSGDQEAITRTRARLESSVRRSRAGSSTARALADHVAAPDANDPEALRALAEQLRADARTRRAASARSRRTVRRLERERIRSLLGQVDAVFTQRRTAGDSGERAAPPEAPPKVEATLPDRVRQAYATLASGPNDLVRLADLRPLLGGIPPEEINAALKDMSRAGQISLVPDSDRKNLTEADHAAAVKVGGEDNHLIAIDAPAGQLVKAPESGQGPAPAKTGETVGTRSQLPQPPALLTDSIVPAATGGQGNENDWVNLWAMLTLASVPDEAKQHIKGVRITEPGEMPPDRYGDVQGDEVRISSRIFTDEGYAELRAMQASGWLTSVGNSDLRRAVLAHELGHLLTHTDDRTIVDQAAMWQAIIDAFGGGVAVTDTSEIHPWFDAHRSKIVNEIGSYAATNTHELIAELVAQYDALGDNAHPAAQAAGRALLRK